MVLTVLLPFVGTCGSSSPRNVVSAKNYLRNCTTVADCVPVYEGPVGFCGGGCPNTSIRADALPKFMSDFNMASQSNAPAPCPQGSQASLCDTGRVACVSGVCQLETPDASPTD
jgi:hypothetical protein